LTSEPNEKSNLSISKSAIPSSSNAFSSVSASTSAKFSTSFKLIFEISTSSSSDSSSNSDSSFSIETPDCLSVSITSSKISTSKSSIAPISVLTSSVVKILSLDLAFLINFDIISLNSGTSLAKLFVFAAFAGLAFAFPFGSLCRDSHSQQ